MKVLSYALGKELSTGEIQTKLEIHITVEDTPEGILIGQDALEALLNNLPDLAGPDGRVPFKSI